MESSWKVICAFVGVFIAGAVFGGVFTLGTAAKRSETQTPPPVLPPPAAAVVTKPAQPVKVPPVTPVMMQRLAQQLKLTEEQREKIRPIVARAEEDLLRLRRTNFRETTLVMDRMHVDITAWLTPEQRDELELLKVNLQERLRNAEKGKQRANQQTLTPVSRPAVQTTTPAAANTSPPVTPPVKGN